MKPVKTEGNEGETRGGAYVMEMDVPIFKAAGSSWRRLSKWYRIGNRAI